MTAVWLVQREGGGSAMAKAFAQLLQANSTGHGGDTATYSSIR